MWKEKVKSICENDMCKMEKGFALFLPYPPKLLIYSCLACFYLPYSPVYLPNMLNYSVLMSFLATLVLCFSIRFKIN